MASQSEASQIDLQCVICFEAMAQAMRLPCDCTVTYCVGCWDRSLAHSFRTCGRARCPTCREPVRVDFDAECGQMKFSRDDPDDCTDEDSGGTPSTSDATSHRAWQMQRRSLQQKRARERLVEQARPAQVRILERYGSAHPSLREDVETATLAERCVAAAQDPPTCVCGGLLCRLSFSERMRRFLERRLPACHHSTPEFEELLRRQIERRIAACSCDLCGKQVLGAVWMCEKEDRTILHANVYDVCEDCFILHARGGHPSATCGYGLTTAV